MSSTTSLAPKISPVQQVEAAKGRLDAFLTRRTRAQALLEAEQARLDAARVEAGIEYGQDTLEGLRTLHVKRNGENERAAAEFLQALAKAEEQMNAVDAQLAAS